MLPVGVRHTEREKERTLISSVPRWDPAVRLTAKEGLDHPWIAQKKKMVSVGNARPSNNNPLPTLSESTIQWQSCKCLRDIRLFTLSVRLAQICRRHRRRSRWTAKRRTDGETMFSEGVAVRCPNELLIEEICVILQPVEKFDERLVLSSVVCL